MYYDFFGLNTAPFRVTPDTSLFYAGGEREALLNAIVYAVSHGDGMVKVVGEVGSGKTMLTRMLEKKLPKSVTIIYLPNPSLAAKDLVFAIGHELGLDLSQDQTKTHALVAIQKKLLEIHASNQRVVVFIDEAQCMPLDTLEELRLLTNLETETDKLLQLVLFGQPELDDHLSHPSVRQIKERIIHNLYLKPFTHLEVAEYLAFRLHKAGYNSSPLFSHSALKALAKYSDGLPRRLSILADKSMLAAFASQSRTVSTAHVRSALGDHQPDVTTQHRRPWLGYGITSVSLILLLAITVSLFVFNKNPLEFFKPPVTNVENTSQRSLDQFTKEDLNAINADGLQSPSVNKGVSNLSTKQPDPIEFSSASYPFKDVSLDNTPLLKQALTKTKIWKENPGNERYTIQIMSTEVDKKNKLEEFLNSFGKKNLQGDLFIYPVIQNNEMFYAVTYGGFVKYQVAKEQLESLPDDMKRFNPFIKLIARSSQASIQ